MKNKKLKWAIPLAIVALGGSSMALTACKKNKDNGNEEPPAHVHEYTEWVNTDPDEHWKICPDDGEIDESTREEHNFVDGECECGAEEVAVYGSVKGEVKLYKMGENVTDFTGIDVDLNDDYVDIKTSTEGGKFTYAVSDVKVGKEYTLTIKKTGYKPYSTTVKLLTENQEAVIGGADGVTLDYEVFGLMLGWDSAEHDFSHVNDAENTYITFRAHTGNKTLNVLSADSYKGDVSASMKVKFDNSTNGLRTQGIVLKFADGKHLVVRYHNGDVANGNIQYCNALWDKEAGGFTKANTLFSGSDEWQWGEHKIHDLTASEGAKIKADGADLKVILKGGVLYTFFDGKYIGEHELPEGYDAENVQVGYFIFDTANNAVFHYDISAQVPAEMKTTLDIDVTQPAEATSCAVTASPVKEKYDFGDEIELTIAPQEGYILSALTVGGEDMFKAVKNNKLTVTADRPTLDVKATFVKEEPIALSLTVKGKKLGKTVNLAAGTEVRFSGIDTPFTVGADGKITGEKVVKTRYTVSVDGYFDKDIVFDEELKEITLEFDTFKDILGWGSFNFDNQNAATPEFKTTNDGSAVFTNETYAGDVVATLYLHNADGDEDGIKANGVDNGTNEGVLFRFVSEGMSDLVTVRMENGKKIQFSVIDLWQQYTPKTKVKAADGSDWVDLIFFADDNPSKVDAKAEEYLEKYKEGTLKLTVMRKEATFFVFLDDRYIGQHTFDDKYKTAECEVGFLSENTIKDVWKTWKVEIDDNPVLAKAELTDETEETEHGSLTLPTGELTIGDTVEIVIVPETTESAKYKLKTLTVGGVDVTAKVVDLKYTFTIGGDTVVKATFEEIVEGAIDCEISGKKLGVTGNAIKAGDDVMLSAPGLSVIETKVVEKGGKLVIDETGVPIGTYTVTVAGYKTATLTVEKNQTYSTAIALEYETLISSDDQKTGVDLSQMNSGKVIAVGNDKNVDVTTSESYLDVTATAVFDIVDDYSSKQRRYGIMLKFDNNTNLRVDLDLGDGDSHACALQETNWGTMMGFNWGSPKTYSHAEVAGFVTNGFTYTLARRGELVSIIANGELIKSYTLPDEYKNQKAKLGFIMDSNNISGETKKGFTYSFSEQAVNVTNETAQNANGEVTFNKASYNLYDTVNLTIAAAADNKLAKLEVGGVDVTSSVTGGTSYSFVAVGDTTVKATFEAIVASSVNAEFVAKKLGVTGNALKAGDTVTLKSHTVPYITATVAAGEAGKLLLTADNVPAGEYTISKAGYIPLNITVGATAYAEAITMQYDTFYAYKNWGTWDFSKQNDGTISMTNGLEMAFTKDTFDEVAFSVLLGQKQPGKDGNQGIAFRFGDDIATIKMENQQKVQVLGGTYADWYVSPGNIAAGSKLPDGNWHDLIFLTGDNADANAATYLQHYNAGTLKLTCVRKGATVYVFLDDTYVGMHTFDAKYANVKASVGYSIQGYNDDVKKEWTAVSLETDISSYLDKVTAYGWSKVTMPESETDFTGAQITLTDRDDATKTYTVELKKSDERGYYFEGNFRPGHYNITMTGYTCTAAGKDEQNADTTQLWIDSEGGQLWGVTFVADAPAGGETGETGGETGGEEVTPEA